MKIGVQIGKHFVGFIATKGLIEPFTENVESGMKYVVSGSPDEILQRLRGDMTDTYLIELFGSIAEIYAPVHAIASRVVSGNYQFRRTTASKAPVRNNEDLNKFLTQPNPFQNFYELLYEAVVYELVCGKEMMFFNTPGTLPRMDYKNVIATYNLPVDKITIDLPERIKLFSATKLEDVIKGYILEKGTLDEVRFKTANVLYRKATNLNWKDRKMKGRSPLLSAEKAIANLIQVYEARFVVFSKRGRMGMWVSAKKDDSGKIALTSTEKKNAAKDLNDEYGLARNKQTVGITDAPIDFVKTSMSIAELLPFEETSADAAAIYGTLDVPYELAPKPQGETFANQLTAEKGLYQNKCIPIANSWCMSITNQLNLGEAGIEMFVDFRHIEVLQEDASKQANKNLLNNQTYLSQFTNGIITLNQWLGKVEMDNSTNPMYNKLIYDMTPEELAIVKEILNIQKPTGLNNATPAPAPTNS